MGRGGGGGISLYCSLYSKDSLWEGRGGGAGDFITLFTMNFGRAGPVGVSLTLAGQGHANQGWVPGIGRERS